MYENQIKHMESEMEQLREENERLKKLLGETS
jgi:cell shape-determining protein MreC